MGAVADALEALGHPPGALPEPRRLADLFVRFQAQVPLRRAPEAGAETLLAAWLEDGSGLCGAPRVAAFVALAEAAGFAVEHAVARDGRGATRPVLLADGGRLLLDVAFPLPVPLSLDPPAEGIATGYGTLSVRGTDGASAVFLETRGDERLLFRVGRAGDENADTLGAEADAVPIAGSRDVPRGPASERLFRLHDDRLLRWDRGVLEVTDSWSRLRIPFPSSDVDGLEALFGPPVPPVDAGAPLGDGIEPTLAVYLASAAAPDALREIAANPETHAAILPGEWTPTGVTRHDDGFEWELRERRELLRRERLRRRADGIVIEAEGPLALFRTRTLRYEPRPNGTRLRLLATLRDAVPPRGLPEATRRRLVFELASELLALDRCAAER